MLDNFLFENKYANSHLILQATSSRGALVLGDFNSAIDPLVLENNNIRTIITAAAGLGHLKIDPAIRHITFELRDTKNQSISHCFEQSYHLIEQSLNVGGVLVHCAAGVSRSAALVIAYLMRKNKFGFKAALLFVKNIRSAVCPNLGFEMQLKQYEKKLLNPKGKPLSRTLIPLKNNVFSLFPEDYSIDRSSFPVINSLGKTLAKSTIRKHIQSREQYAKIKHLNAESRLLTRHEDISNKRILIGKYGESLKRSLHVSLQGR